MIGEDIRHCGVAVQSTVRAQRGGGSGRPSRRGFSGSYRMHVLAIDAKACFFSSIIKYCIRYGKAYRTANFEAVACRKLPGDTRFTLWRMFRSGMLKLPSVLGKEKFSQFLSVTQKLDDLVARQMGSRKYLYCLTLGTHPDKQRQGFGGLLMRETFDFARSLGVPCYLPTFTLSALSAHKHNGYVELENYHFAEYNLSVYCMLNELGHK